MRKGIIPKPVHYYVVANVEEARSWITNLNGEAFNAPYNNIKPNHKFKPRMERLYVSQLPIDSFLESQYENLAFPYRGLSSFVFDDFDDKGTLLFGQLSVGPKRGINHRLLLIFEHDCELDYWYDEDVYMIDIIDSNGRHAAFNHNDYYEFLFSPKITTYKFSDYKDVLNGTYMDLWEENLKHNETEKVYPLS